MELGIILLILFIVILWCNCSNSNTTENLTNVEYSCTTKNKLLDEIIKQRYDNQDINNTEKNDIYIPCSYNYCEKEAKSFENNKGKKIFVIDGCDVLASKITLWKVLKDKFGINATSYMPLTHILEEEMDLNNFISHYKQNKDQMYILKNFKQRQEGIKITKDLDEILNGVKNGWYLVQDYLYDPFLVDKRKTNFRYYLLIICFNGDIKGYIHNNGFVYYTPEYYDKKSSDFKKHITTGYIDRKIYDKNPLTIEDFRKYLDNDKKGNSNIWDKNINELFYNIMCALSDNICNNKKLDETIRFQLFGCDIQPDSKLNVKLIEINKGPDLGAKDERDKQVKRKVQEDVLKIVDPQYINEDQQTQFIRIY